MNDCPEIHAIAMLTKQMLLKSNTTNFISKHSVPEHHDVNIDNYINWGFDQTNEHNCHFCDKCSCIYIHDNATHINSIYCMSCFEKKIYHNKCMGIQNPPRSMQKQDSLLGICLS